MNVVVTILPIKEWRILPYIETYEIGWLLMLWPIAITPLIMEEEDD